MALYRVLAKSFIGNTLVEEGAEIDYDGRPGPNLAPLDDGARAAAKGAAKSRDPFDHDGDGKPGGSKPKAEKPSADPPKAEEPKAGENAALA